MGFGWNRGFVPCRGGNQWGIETKASNGISLSRFVAKLQGCAVLLTPRFSNVKLPSIGMLSCRSRIRSCQGVNVPQERTITSISDSSLSAATLPSFCVQRDANYAAKCGLYQALIGLVFPVLRF